MTALARKLLETTPRVRQALIVKLRRGGLRYTLPQLQILRLISECPHTVSELAELQGVTKATMSATISRLVSRGLISRNYSLDDRRQIVIEPTLKGRAVSDEATRNTEAIADDLLACLTNTEKDALMAGLDLLTSALDLGGGSDGRTSI